MKYAFTSEDSKKKIVFLEFKLQLKLVTLSLNGSID